MEVRMEREELLNKMRVTLTEKMHEVLESHDDDRASHGWIGDCTARLMAEAAVTVFAATCDVNDYMEREHLVKV
jgi:hypothetical protein